MRPQSCGIMLLIALSLSCHHASRNDKTSLGIPAAIAGKVMGLYTGNFSKGMITVTINYISGKNVSGYNVHKGLRRNINGEGVLNGNRLDFVLKEPGDNLSDGTFYFSIDTSSLKINGRWVAKDSLKISPKKLALSRKEKLELLENYGWTTSGSNDTTITFNTDNTCSYDFYERAHDSTSQLITVMGNFEVKGDTFRIEWQKNVYTPAQTMKLIEIHQKKKTDEGEEYETLTLEGQGWKFVPFEGD